MKALVVLGIALLFYMALIFPLADYMGKKPFAEKLGYLPQPEVLKLAAADQKQSLAVSLMLKVLIYFGTLVEKSQQKIELPPDYLGIYKHIEATVKLDPYNIDAYYFAQAILVWDVKRITLANSLLEHGIKYRTWDWYLPFFAGFNHAYFLKDYGKAAEYYRRAGDLSGQELHISLAGRYMQEAGRTDLAIAYLTAMEKGATNEAVKKTFRRRLQAFKEVRLIERARDRYRAECGALSASVEELLERGYLSRMPVDPYGGKFFWDEEGRVMSTSKFAPTTGRAAE